MADAEIIPLGTRGRPGRGTGRDKPSSSSRGARRCRARRTTATPAEDAAAREATDRPAEEPVEPRRGATCPSRSTPLRW